MSLCIQVQNNEGDVLASAAGVSEAVLVYEPEYSEGDCILVESENPGVHLILQLDDTLPPVLAYLREKVFRYRIPFGENRISYSPRAFLGKSHLLSVRLAGKDEILCRRNLALNPLDSHENSSLFPHASANVETRGEAVFAARNAIDGLKASHFHGEWPYTSWGINRDPTAELKLEFGRTVQIDRAVFYLRADFPHDAWWESTVLHFSDGSSVTAKLEKTDAAQPISFEPKQVEWAVLDSLIKADDPSPFPALTQLEFYGRDI